MAKKLNKKVAIICIVLIILVLGTISAFLIGPKVARRLGIFQNPDKSLAKARELVAAGDYENAEREFGLAYTFGKSDAYKVERLFELAEFHLINNDQHQVDWGKARACWQKIISIDADNIEAREKLLDFLYQIADNGDERVWKSVNEQTTELLEVMERKGIEPDTSLLIKDVKSLLAMAQRGESTNRQELLDNSIEKLDSLIEKEPENDELYLLRSQAALLRGEIEQLAGVRNALEESQENAMKLLEAGVENADDKAAATANLLSFKIQKALPDPNEIDKVRAEIKTQSEKFPSSDKLLLVTSIAYEFPGNMPMKAALNQSIEAIRQARELNPEDIEYTIRLFLLLYRKGASLNDPDAIADAVDLAENALLLPGAQDVPGPLQGRNRQYRLIINSFLAEAYLEKSYQAKKVNDEDAAQNWYQKAEPCIEEIRNLFGTSENPVVQKFDGMLALAKGEEDKAIRLMYAAYEQTKAIDRVGAPSSIDPILCVTLADLMKERNEPGLQLEFLQKAVSNRQTIIRQRPEVFLDYSEIAKKLRGWNDVLIIVNTYENRYGVNLKSQVLRAQAQIALDQLDEATETISEIPTEEPASVQLKIDLLTRKIERIQQKTTIEEAMKNQELSAKQMQELKQLRNERLKLLQQNIDQVIETINVQTLITVCRDLIQDSQISAAVMILDKCLNVYPDNIMAKMLKLQVQEENPLQIPGDRLLNIQEEAWKSLQDPIKRNVGLAQLYRTRGDYENARKALEEIPPSQANVPEVLVEKFNLAFDEKNIQEAESLLLPIRSENLDRCEGNLFSARVEYLKQNYELVLRQLDECLVIQPLSSQIYFLKGLVYNQLKDYESAMEALQTARRMNPLDPPSARLLASVLFTRNTELGSKVTPQQQDEAQQAITAAMVLNPLDWQLQSVYAETIRDKQPDEALSIRQLLLQQHPTMQNAILLGNMATEQAKSEFDTAKITGLLELANNAYRQAIQLAPENEGAQQIYADFLRLTGKGQDAINLLKDDQNLLWKYYLRNSQFQQAKEILDVLYEKAPEDTMVLRGLVLVAEGMGDRAQAKQYLDALASLVDDKEGELWSLQKYLDNAFTEEVEAKLESFKERYPEETVTLLLEAWIQMRHGNLDEALSFVNRYLETETENAGAWRLRGRLYRLMNQPQKAIADLQRSKRIQANPAVRMELASVYNEMGNPQGAIGELKEGLNDPQAPYSLWAMLEAIYKETGDLKALERFYLDTLAKYPQSTFWLNRIGEFYLKQKNFPKAQQFLKNAWDLLQQRDIQPLSLLITYLESLYEGGQYDETFSLASGFVDTPAASAAYTYIALTQLKMGQSDKANDNFKRALQKVGTSEQQQQLVMEKMLETVGPSVIDSWCKEQLSQDPDSLSVHLLAYRLGLVQERYNNAVEHLDKCMELVGEEHAGWITLATTKSNVLLLAYTKTTDENYLNLSVTLLEMIREKQPENASILNNLAYLLIDNDKELETALSYVQKAIQSNAANPVYLDTYAYGLCKTGRYKEAEQNLLRAIQLNEVSNIPIPWDMFKHLGMAYEGLGNNRQAIENYQKALDAAANVPEKEKQQLQETIEKLKVLQ